MFCLFSKKTTNLPAKTTMALVIPAAAAAEMAMVGSKAKAWME